MAPGRIGRWGTLLRGSCASLPVLCRSTGGQAGPRLHRARSQLVNHCPWFPVPGAETHGHSCWGRAQGGALSLLRCHLVVAAGSVAAQVVGAGGGCRKQSGQGGRHPHLPGWKSSPWLELAPPRGHITLRHVPSGQGHCFPALPPPRPGANWGEGEPVCVARYLYSLPCGPRGPGP